MDKTLKPGVLKKRLFFAIKINPDKRFLELYSEIKNSLNTEKIKWVRPENLHITLRFLGSTDIELIPLISEKLEHAFESQKVFMIDLHGLGVFKTIHNPKVIWVGVKSAGDLILVKQTLDLALKSLFPLEEDSNIMHLTLGRIKMVANRELWKEIVQVYRELKFMEMKVEKITMFESKLEKTGPFYHEIKEFHLGLSK